MKDNEGCHFLLTNQDATFPTNGTTYPGLSLFLFIILIGQISDRVGSGAMSAPLVFASKKTPTIIGKPNKIMMDAIIAEYVFFPPAYMLQS